MLDDKKIISLATLDTQSNRLRRKIKPTIFHVNQSILLVFRFSTFLEMNIHRSHFAPQ